MKRLILLLFLIITTLSFSSRHYHREHSWDDVEIDSLDLPWEEVELDDLEPWDDIKIDDDFLDGIEIKKNRIKIDGIDIGDDDLDIKIKRKKHHWKHKKYDYDDDDDENDD